MTRIATDFNGREKLQEAQGGGQIQAERQGRAFYFLFFARLIGVLELGRGWSGLAFSWKREKEIIEQPAPVLVIKLLLTFPRLLRTFFFDIVSGPSRMLFSYVRVLFDNHLDSVTCDRNRIPE